MGNHLNDEQQRWLGNPDATSDIGQTVTSASTSNVSKHLIVPYGEVLNGEYRILGRAWTQNHHCDVYDVQRLQPCGSDHKLEARVYDLEGLSSSFEKYRRRAMSRLTARSVLKIRWSGLEVIVYSTSNIGKRLSKERFTCSGPETRRQAISQKLKTTGLARNGNSNASYRHSSATESVCLDSHDCAKETKGRNTHWREEIERENLRSVEDAASFAADRTSQDEDMSNTELVMHTSVGTKRHHKESKTQLVRTNLLRILEEELALLQLQLRMVPSAIEKRSVDLRFPLREYACNPSTRPEHATEQSPLTV